ncbi:MAG: 3-mercaptopyruvate sulfurtransferase [Alphaproteobacteria bacterium]|nr:3-mercaptopyruvate sulfurtransferase [Alphaproteobacteria bacterium]
MASFEGNALVSTAWLAEHRNAPDIRVVDATYALPTLKRNPRAEYQDAHIPGAVFFDIDDVADENSDLPHMVPDATKFSSRVRRLGLGDGVRIVVYDNNRFSASARVWWMFRMFGHDDVVVLDGGLGKWWADGYAVDDQPVTPTERHFTARQNNLLYRDLDQIRAHVMNPTEQLIDARSAGRFRGEDVEPRAGMRSGHIPYSLNLPFTDLVAPDGTFLPIETLRQRFAEAGVDPRKPIATTCGSGVTACTLALALYQLGVPDVAIYDGSWTEWGGRADTPIET